MLSMQCTYHLVDYPNGKVDQITASSQLEQVWKHHGHQHTMDHVRPSETWSHYLHGIRVHERIRGHQMRLRGKCSNCEQSKLHREQELKD